MRINEVDRELTQTELDQLETFADRLFAKVGIDVEFTRHFLDRVNDERNVKQITASELTRLFKQEYKKWGKDIVKLGPDSEAVLKDLATDLNVPFALRWDNANNELDLIAKTVMRKPDFKTSNQEFAIESAQQLNEAGPAVAAVPLGIVAWQAYSVYRYSKAAWWIAQGAKATATTAAAYIVSNEVDFSWLERKMAASALLAYELWDKVRGVEDLSNDIVAKPVDKLNSELVAGTEVLTKQALETNSISAETAEIIDQTNAAADKMNDDLAKGVEPSTIANNWIDSYKNTSDETVKQLAVVSPEVVKAIQTELEANYQDASGQRASEIAAQQKAVKLAQAKADAQTKASDDRLKALAKSISDVQAQQANDKYQNDKIDDIATKSDAQAQADAQTKASDEKLIALANKVAATQAATQAQQANDKYQNDKIDNIATTSDAAAKADAQTKASDANLIAKGQAYAQAQADAQAKADAAANDKYQNDKIRDLEKNPLPIANFDRIDAPAKDTPLEIPTTGKTTVKEPIKVTVPTPVIVQPENPAVDFPSTTQGTAVKTPDITKGKVDSPERDSILTAPITITTPNTKVDTTTIAKTNTRTGKKPKRVDLTPGGYNDLYQTNLYKWTQKYGTFENSKLNKMLLGENSISTRTNVTRNKTGNSTNQTFSKYISKTADTGGTSLSKVSNLNKTANGTTGTTTKRFIRPGGSGTNTTYDHGTGKVTRTNVQLKGPQSWMYDKKLNSSVTKEDQLTEFAPVVIAAITAAGRLLAQRGIKIGIDTLKKAATQMPSGATPEAIAQTAAAIVSGGSKLAKQSNNESMASLRKKLFIIEGGAMPGVGAIHIDEINPTLEQLEKSLGLGLKDFTLGSVGKRQFSGDIDVALNLPPEELPAFVEKLKKNPLIKDIAKSSVIMTKVQIQNFDKSKSDGRPRTGFVQVDFMPGDPGWLKTYFHSPSEDESKYKGVFRNVMVATMAAVHNRDDSDAEVEDGRPLESRRFMWSPTDGLVRVLRTPVPAKNGNGYTKKNQNKVIDGPWKQADEIAKQLGLNSAKDLNSFESLLDAMKKSYTQEEQKKVIDNLKDSKVVQDIGIPDEIKDL